MASSSSDLEELEHRKSVLEKSLEEKRRMIRKKRKQKLREEIADKERELEETDKEMQEIDDESSEQPQEQTPQSGCEKPMQLRKAKTPHKPLGRSRKTGMNKQPSISDTRSEESSTKRTDDGEKDKPQEHKSSSLMLKKRKRTLISTERKRSQSTSDDRKRKEARKPKKKKRYNQRDNRGRFVAKINKEIIKEEQSTPRKQQRQCSLEILTPYIQDTDTSRSPLLITQQIKTPSKIYSSSEDSDIYIAPTDTHIRETKARKIKDDKLMKSVKVILQRFVQHKQISKNTVIRIPVEIGHHSEESSSNESIKVMKIAKPLRSTKIPEIVIKKQPRSSGSLSSDQSIAKRAKWQNRDFIDNKPKKIVVQEAKYTRFMGKDIRGIHRRKKASNTRKMLESKRRRKIEKEEHKKEVARLIKEKTVETDEYSSFNFVFKLSEAS